MSMHKITYIIPFEMDIRFVSCLPLDFLVDPKAISTENKLEADNFEQLMQLHLHKIRE
jgi:hypothetical protein